MKYTCDICGHDFEGWTSDVPFVSGLFDSIVVKWRNHKTVCIEDHKLCPDCRDKILDAIDKIRMENGYYD